MLPFRSLAVLAVTGALIATAACTTAPYSDRRFPAPRPAMAESPTQLGTYLAGDVVGGRSARLAKLRRAGIRLLGGGEVTPYMDRQEADLRRQTVGTGVEVIRSGNDVVLRMPSSITFPVGSFAIQPQFQSTLREIAQTLHSDNQTYVDVLGHTDASGSDATNLALSLSRAQAVANYLKSRGIVAARLGVKGYGEAAPIASNDGEEGRSQNRRIEIRLVAATN